MNDNNLHNTNFLKDNLGNKKSFTTPENYFDGVEDNFFIKLKEESLPKGNSFTTPHNYFESLEDTLLNKIQENKEVKVISLKSRILKFTSYAAAASVVLFIALNSFVFNTNNSVTFDSLSESDIEFWIDNEDIFTGDLATVYEEDIESANALYFTEIQDEQIEDYLINTDSDLILNTID